MPPKSHTDISLVPFKAAEIAESPTLIIQPIKPATTPLRSSSPDRMRIEAKKAPLVSHRSMSVVPARVVTPQQTQLQRSKTPVRSSFPARPVTPSRLKGLLDEAGCPRSKTPVRPRTAFGGRLETTTPRSSSVMRQSQPHRPSTAVTPLSSSFGAGALRSLTPGRSLTPSRNPFPLSPRPSAPNNQGQPQNKAKQTLPVDLKSVAEVLTIRSAVGQAPMDLTAQIRKALSHATHSAARSVLMHSVEAALSSKETATAIASVFLSEIDSLRKDVCKKGSGKLQKAFYLDLRKISSEGKSTSSIKWALGGFVGSSSVLILDGLECLREFQRLDMDSAMMACEACAHLLDGLDCLRKSRSSAAGKDNSSVPILIALVRSNGQSVESCVDEAIVKRMAGPSGVIRFSSISLAPPRPVTPPSVNLSQPTATLKAVSQPPRQKVSQAPCSVLSDGSVLSDEMREEWLVMHLMEVEAALGVDDVASLVRLTSGYTVKQLARLFSQALDSSRCTDGLADALFFSHFEPLLIFK